jgi:hypothetical protein
MEATKSAKIKYRIISDHKRTCRAKQFCSIPSTKKPIIFLRRSPTGKYPKNTGNDAWVQFTCNDPKCDAIVAVYLDDFLRSL